MARAPVNVWFYGIADTGKFIGLIVPLSWEESSRITPEFRQKVLRGDRKLRIRLKTDETVYVALLKKDVPFFTIHNWTVVHSSVLFSFVETFGCLIVLSVWFNVDSAVTRVKIF